jgi:hypothetical protein
VRNRAGRLSEQLIGANATLALSHKRKAVRSIGVTTDGGPQPNV